MRLFTSIGLLTLALEIAAPGRSEKPPPAPERPNSIGMKVHRYATEPGAA
ncbi:MAG: hypothetical protein JRG96_02265 [Deltaproteobacteria bacterium]|nr:hypothetical protein [Deltaproteobacteria bacterium]MBW2420572.1 hypothetical protein [Deltaproteobacteria bacterium]